MCADLTCASDEDACKLNQLSYMIKEVAKPLLLDDEDSVQRSVETHSVVDENVKALSLRYQADRLYYNIYSAGFHILAEEMIYETKAILKIEPVPFSRIRDSRLNYDKIDLEMERLSSFVFLKSLSELESYEFVRSSVINFYLDTFEYNHFPLGIYSLKVHFNKVWNMPNFQSSAKEIKRVQTEANLGIDISEPKNYYCLGMYVESSKTWRCVSREIVGINDNTIEFKVMTTGTFAVLFFPRANASKQEICGLLCEYRREIATFFFVIVPVFAIVIGYAIMLIAEAIKFAKRQFKAVLAKGEEAFFENGKAGKAEKEKSETDQLMAYPDDEIDINENIDTFNNPLVFDSTNKLGEMGENDLDREKVRLKYKADTLLNEKLKLLKKISALASEIDMLKENIDKEKQLQDLNGVEKLEREARERSLINKKSKAK